MSRGRIYATHHVFSWLVLLVIGAVFIAIFGLYRSTESATTADTSSPPTKSATGQLATSFPVAVITTTTLIEQDNAPSLHERTNDSLHRNVLGISVDAETNETETTPPEEPLKAHDDSLAEYIHTFSNRSRESRSLPSLTLDPRLNQLATLRSEEMVKEHYFSHTTPNGCNLTCRFQASGYRTLVWGENLATFSDVYALDTEALASNFVSQWLASNSHRDNLLSTEFTHHGIGVSYEGSRVVVTVIFAKPE